MKKILLLTNLLILFYCFKVNAQYCGSPFNGNICPPDTQTKAGFSPSEDFLPCMVPGVAYSQVIQVFVPDTFTYQSLHLTLDSVHIDTISNLPCGMCWSFTSAGNTIQGGTAGCLLLQGTTSDAPGEYLLHVIVDAYIQNLGKLPGENLSTLGLSFYVRVANTDGSCLPVDTSSAGNTTSPPGEIATPTITGDTVICNASNTLSVTGGTYAAYSWSTGATTDSISANMAGTYTVTVYANCNSATASITVTSPNAPAIISASGDTTFCQGDSVVLTASAGSSFAWSNLDTTQVITVTQSGNYSVTISNNGCSAVSLPTVVTVNQPTSGTVDTSICAGNTFSFNGKSYSTGGTYYDTIPNSNNCDSIISLVLTIDTIPPVPTITQSGDTLLTAAGYTSYNWYSVSGGTLLSAGNNNSYVVTQSGYYYVLGFNGACSAESDTFQATVTGIAAINEPAIGLTVYPNPASDLLHVQLSGLSGNNAISIKFYDVVGRVIEEQTITGGATTYDLPVIVKNFAEGLYLLQVRQGTQSIQQRVVIGK